MSDHMTAEYQGIPRIGPSPIHTLYEIGYGLVLGDLGVNDLV